MGEIVRVLKWRLDVDADGMASGIDKAATSAERLQKATAEVGEKGAAGLKKAESAAGEAEESFKGLEYEAQQVEMYVGRLEKGAGSPLVLKRNAELAEAAFNTLAASAQKAGQVIPSEFADRAAAAIEKATTQSRRMNEELEKLGGQTPTKLDKVIVALEKTQESSADAWAALRKMGEEGEKAAAALQRMEKASDSPRELQRNAALAEMEMNKLREAIDRARTSGQKIGSDVGTSMSQAGDKIRSANVRAAEMRDTLGDMKTRGDQAAKGFEATAGAAGSLEGILGRLKDTGGATSQTLSDIGFAVLSMGAAFKMGHDAGTQLREVLQGIGVPLPDLSNKVGDAIVNMEKFARGTKDTKSAASTLSGSLVDVVMKLGLVAAGYGKTEQAENDAIKRARAIIAAKAAQAKAEQDVDNAITKAIPGWRAAGEQQKELAKEIDAASKALEGITKVGLDWRKEVEANQAPLEALAKKIEAGKIKLSDLPGPLREAIEYLKQLRGAAADAGGGIDLLNTALKNIGSGGVGQSIEAVAKALGEMRKNGEDVSKAVSENAGAFQKLRDAAGSSYDTLDKFRKEIADQIPAWQATALAGGDYTNTINEQAAAAERYFAARKKANEADIEASIAMAQARDAAIQQAYAIDTIGEAYAKATGQCAGFTTEVRRGRKEVVEADPEWTKFIDSLAGVSDEYERMVPWVGALIAQLEQGNITGAEFQRQIEAWRTGFIQLQGVSGQMFGDIDTLFNRLNHLMNEFTRGGSGPSNDRFTPKGPKK